MASSANIDLSGHRAEIPPVVGALFSGVDDLVVLIGADLRPRWSSRPLTAFFDETGSVAAGALGGSVHPDDQPHMRELRSELLATPGATVECDVRIITADGTYVPVRLRGANHFHDPSIDGFVVTVHWPEPASRRSEPTPLAHRVTEAPRGGGGPVMATSVFPVADLLDDASRAMTSLCDGRGVVLRTRLDQTLPTPIRAPRAHLLTILTHLITSAVRASPIGSATPAQVEIAASAVEGKTDRLRFTISAHAAEDARGDNRWVSSVGDAELMSAAALVEQLDSSIDVSTGERSRTLAFDVSFRPARRLADRVHGENTIRAASRRPRQPDAPSEPPQTARSGPVLVVDDSDVNRLLAASQLDRLGYEHIEASGGEEALRIMRGGNVALVLMDWHMPGLDGLAATERWRSLENGATPLPIISMTASAMAGDRERCLAAGASDYLPKPVSISDLASALERWLPTDEPSDLGSDRAPTDPIDELVTELGDVAVVESIVRAYVEMIPTQLDEAQVAWRSGDRGVVRRCAHTLKSTATMLGYVDFAALCADLEALARRDEGDLASSLDRFSTACESTTESLLEVLRRLQDRPPA